MTILWAVNVIVAKVALREFPVFTLTELRMALSSVLLLPLFLRQPWREEMERLRQAGKTLLLMSLFGVAFNQILFVAAVKYTSVAHTAIIISMTPVFVLIVARLKGLEPLTVLKITGLVTCMAGVSVLTMARGAVLDGSGPTLQGDIYAALGSFAFACFAVIGKGIAGRFSAVSLTTSMFVIGAIMLLPVSAWELWHGSAREISVTGWLSLLYMAMCASVIAYLIFFWAMQRLAATRVTVLSYLQPVFVTLLSVVFLKEKITPMEVASAAVILAGVYMTERG